MSRYKHSLAAYERAITVTPGGAQTMSKQPARFPLGAFPAYLYSGEGARVVDVDGSEYVDWICGLGALPLGYRHPVITQAILEELHHGFTSASLPTELEWQVAARLTSTIPCAQDQGMVRFVKTGSEACAAAVRIARRATGRELVIVVGYHGWHDWVMVTNDPHPGVPDCYGHAVRRVPYNDATVIKDIMTNHPVAAVILEPTLLEPPIGNYLSDVATLCTLHGAVSIFDEMVMGFRWARAGGQEYFKVVPDLAVYGKGLANGMPLACVVGPERFMRYADVISGTFGGECLSLAAAYAVLRIYEDKAPITAQWADGREFLRSCDLLGIPHTGYAVHPKITYTGKTMAIFLQETAKRGLLLHPGGFNVPAVLTERDRAQTWEALKGAKEAMDSGVTLEGVLPALPLFKRTT